MQIQYLLQYSNYLSGTATQIPRGIAYLTAPAHCCNLECDAILSLLFLLGLEMHLALLFRIKPLL